MFEGTNKQPHV